MKKITLSNGLRVVKTSNSSVCSLSVTVGIGHLNEPKLGLAAVCEAVLSEQLGVLAAHRKKSADEEKCKAITIQGGTITSHLMGCRPQDFEELLHKVAAVLKNPDLSQKRIDAVVADIAQHTRDLAPLQKRQWKLLYKHTAFGTSKVVWDLDAYIRSLESIKTEDLEAVVDTYYTASNIIIGVACNLPMDTVKELVGKYFGNLPAGEKQQFEKLEYTGGYATLPVIGKSQTVAIGWDVSALSNVAAANVMMSMLAGRLERCLADTRADYEVKIAGYYGMRTLRVSIVTSVGEDVNPLIDVLCSNIKRLCTTEASERRLETSRQRAGTEKLAKFADKEYAAVEIAWQELGRSGMYDIDKRIDATFWTSSYDVQEVSRTIFAAKPTIVISAENPYSEQEILDRLRW